MLTFLTKIAMAEVIPAKLQHVSIVFVFLFGFCLLHTVYCCAVVCSDCGGLGMQISFELTPVQCVFNV